MENPLDIAEDDDENPRVKKIVNKIIDYTLKNKKLAREKLKVRRLKIRHRVIMPGDSRRNRENLVKSELEYFDVLELGEEKKLKILKMMMMMTQKKFCRTIIL
jgi:hypothetical protein